MGDLEGTKRLAETKQPVMEERPAPDEVDKEPEEQLSRPEQPDFDPEEREQYDQPVEEAELREDR